MSTGFKTLAQELGKSLQYKRYNEIPRLLKAYKSVTSDWNNLSAENHNVKCKYTRNNLIELPNNLGQILILIWKPNCDSKVHYHPNSECWVKLLDGKLEENVFIDNQKIATNSIILDDVTHINDSIGSHSMHNRSPNNRAVSLHVYSNNSHNEVYMDYQKSEIEK